MEYKKATIVPNIIFDVHLPTLSFGEIKVLMAIVRQTYGWVSQFTGKRKERDRISHSQFIKKTGLSRRVVSTSLASLSKKELILITDTKGNDLLASDKRKGRTYLFYALKPVQIATPTNAENATQPVQKSAHNKTNYSKIIQTKRNSDGVHIGSLISTRNYL